MKSEFTKFTESKIENTKSENDVLITNLQGFYYLSNESFIQNEEIIIDKIHSGQLSIFELTKATGTLLAIAKKEVTRRKYDEIKGIILFALNRTVELGYSELILDDNFESKGSNVDRYLSQIKIIDTEVAVEFKNVIDRLFSLREESTLIEFEITNILDYNIIELRDKILASSTESIVDNIKKCINDRKSLDVFCRNIETLKTLKDENRTAYLNKIEVLSEALEKITKNFNNVDLLWINTIIESIKKVNSPNN